MLTSKLSFSFVLAPASLLWNYPPALSPSAQPRKGPTPPWGAVPLRSRTTSPARAGIRQLLEAHHIGSHREDGFLPQPCDFFRAEFLPPTAPSTLRGPWAPQTRACPRLTKGNQICCSCSGREQALPETVEVARERFLPAWGCKYLYNVVCGKREGGGRWQERGALRPQGVRSLLFGLRWEG